MQGLKESRLETRTVTAVVFLALFLGIMSNSGCGSSGTFVHPDADLTFYESVGVVPFATLGPDRLAGDKMASVFTTHLMVARRFSVMEPGQFLAAYVKQAGSTGAPPIGLAEDKLKALGDEAKVQGVFEGTVRDYEMTNGNPSRPLISVEIRLVDVAKGQVVWSTSVTRVGKPLIPILGWGGTRTLSELAESVAKDLVERLP
jgi:hypothetical protein